MTAAPMRVLFVTPDFPPEVGGIQLWADRMSVEARNLDSTVLAPANHESEEFDRASRIPVRRAGLGNAPRIVNLAWLNSETVRMGLGGRFDAVVCLHIVAAPGAAALSRLRGIPLVVVLYAMEVPSRPRLAGWACARADRVVAISRYTEQLAVNVGADPSRVRIIWPGVDVDRQPPAEAGVREPTVLVVSRLDDRYKGHDVLLRAMALVAPRVPHARLIVVGGGRLQGHLESLADSFGVRSAVTFTGALSVGERDRWLREARVFAMPSRMPPGGAGEGFGIAYLEAGANRMPVVAGAVGGALDAVAGGKSGVLIDPTDHVALADALVPLLTSPATATRLGDQGRARAESLSWRRAATGLEDVLSEIAPRAE